MYVECTYVKHGTINNPPLQKKIKKRSLQKNRRTIESWRAIKSPRLVKNQRDWKKLVARLLFTLGGISAAADFLLIWLKKLSFRSS
jgi:hypothetical protein